MRAYDLAIQNFSVAEHLLQLHELFRDLQEEAANESLRIAVCKTLLLPEQTVLRQARNEQVVLVAKATVPIPHSLLVKDGINFLLRQAVVVACTALESFFWDALRENVLTIVRARKRGADESLRKLTLSLDDYLSLEGYDDPDIRLQQIILKNFERGSLYDASSIERITTILTVKEFWQQVSRKCGLPDTDIKRQIGELINRRNQVAHRADRPDDAADPVEEQDGHGLRAISYAWANARVATAKNVVAAASEIFGATLKKLENQLEQEAEQQLARKTLRVQT
jgi:HEPN superfamily RiboL-PSP-like protein